MGERGRWARFGWMASGAVIAVTAYEAGRARADGVPATGPLTYSGYLTDSEGAPIDGTKSMSAALYPDKASTSSLCPPKETPVVVKAGRFSIVLDDTCAAAVHANSEAWVELVVDGTKLRSKISAVPYALEADSAQHLALPDCPRGYEKLADNGVPNSTFIACARRTKDGKIRDQVVRVGWGANAYWIDRYEASIWKDPDGTTPANGPYGAGSITEDPLFPSSFPPSGKIDNLSNALYAVSKANVPPSSWMTWFQANLACRASGKRLPTGTEWLLAAMGTPDPPTNSDGSGGTCVTLAANGTKRVAGAATVCISVWGAEDMIGNLAEWTDEWFPGVGKMTSDPIDGPVGNPQVYFPWPPDSDFGNDGTQNIDSAPVYEDLAQNAKARIGLPAVGTRGGGLTEGTGAGIYSLSVGSSPVVNYPFFGFRCLLTR